MAISYHQTALLIVEKGLAIWAGIHHAVYSEDRCHSRMDQSIDHAAVLVEVMTI